MFTFYRIYNDKRRDQEYNLALDEKERTIQRLADQERTWRELFLKEKFNLNDNEIEKIIHLKQGKNENE